jgi:phosphoglycerol transferase
MVPRGTLVGSALLGGELPDGVVVTAQGLSLPEGSGRWSDGKYVRIRMAKPLPRHGIVVLDAAAYGPNSGLPFTLRAGAASTTFRVGGAMRQVDVRIETDGNVRELEIEVPQPVSPHALGRSDDQRALGIRLARIDVLADQLDLTAR